MVQLGWRIFVYGSFVGFGAFLRTWLPFAIIVALAGIAAAVAG